MTFRVFFEYKCDACGFMSSAYAVGNAIPDPAMPEGWVKYRTYSATRAETKHRCTSCVIRLDEHLQSESAVPNPDEQPVVEKARTSRRKRA